MIFAAHQPNLMPYPGFWLKMDRADVFGLMPNAQFSKGDYTNRVQIGWDERHQWLTLPVKQALGQKICDVEFADGLKLEKLGRTLEQVYGKRKFWARYGSYVVSVMSEPCNRLREKNERLILLMREFLQIKTALVSLPENSGDPSRDLADWTIAYGCTKYISGSGARAYLNCESFTALGAVVEYMECHVEAGYKTVSMLSLLMDYGPEWRAHTSTAE